MKAKGARAKKKPPDAPKQRTRQHVIASLSLNHVEGIVYEKGYSAERVVSDYGYDLTVSTYDSKGYVEPGFILLQLKATDTIRVVNRGSEVSFSIDVGDFQAWTGEAYPVFLIVFDVVSRTAYWLYIQKYFADDPARGPRPKAATVSVRLPRKQVLDSTTIDYMRTQKQNIMKKYVTVKHG